MNYKPHRWHYDQLNGWWAHCSCGFSSSALFLRRSMEKHVREATSQDLREAQIRRLTGDTFSEPAYFDVDAEPLRRVRFRAVLDDTDW